MPVRTRLLALLLAIQLGGCAASKIAASSPQGASAVPSVSPAPSTLASPVTKAAADPVVTLPAPARVMPPLAAAPTPSASTPGVPATAPSALITPAATAPAATRFFVRCGQDGIASAPNAALCAQRMLIAGRISVQAQSNSALPQANAADAQGFHGAFVVDGTAEAGTMRLLTPLGTAAAVLRWAPHGAWLLQGSDWAPYPDMQRLLADVTGTPLPWATLWQWLGGQAIATAGWQTDLRSYDSGLLKATRMATSTAPRVDVRIKLEEQEP